MESTPSKLRQLQSDSDTMSAVSGISGISDIARSSSVCVCITQIDYYPFMFILFYCFLMSLTVL